MKRRIIILLVLLSLALCACGTAAEPDPVYTIEKDGKTYTVDTAARTITLGTDVYQYRSSENTNGTTYTIIYPDGAEYYMVCEENLRYGGWNDTYFKNKHKNGDILIDVLWENRPAQKTAWTPSGEGLFPGLILIILGLIDTAYPFGSWYLAHGWHYKDAEPSEISLNMYRFVGILGIIGGIILLFI